RIDWRGDRERRVVAVRIDEKVVGPSEIVELTAIVSSADRDTGPQLVLDGDALLPVVISRQVRVQPRHASGETEGRVLRRTDLVVLNVPVRVQRGPVAVQILPRASL